MDKFSIIYKRTNGFSWPPDKAQIISWLIIIYFGIFLFGTLVVSMSKPYSYSIGTLFAILYLCLVILVILVTAINPGEEETNKKKVVPSNSFDREKHKHVIENQFCNICQIVVSHKAKHCRKCNKCITNFDHHCIYLNNCIGSRNYKIFIATITAVFLGTLLVCLIGIIEFICSFVDNHDFLTQDFNEKNQTLCSPQNCDDKYKYLPIFTGVPINAWRPFVVINVLLALVILGLIGYLISYHIFLGINKLSTYEHTVKLRQKDDEKKIQPNSNINKTTFTNNSIKNNQKEMISIISKTQNRSRTPPIELKYELPPINMSHINTELGDGIINNTEIKPTNLPPLPPLKMTSNNLNSSNQRTRNKLNSLDESLNATHNEKKYKNNHSIDSLPCIMPQKNYLDLNEIMNSESRDSSYFSGYPTNRTDVEQSNIESDHTNYRDRKSTSNIIKLPMMPSDEHANENDNRLTISALSNTLENKRKHRKQLLNLSNTPQSNMSNASSPEPHNTPNAKYLNSSTLNQFNTLQMIPIEKSNFRDLKNATPTTADEQNSDDDIIIGNNEKRSNNNKNFFK